MYRTPFRRLLSLNSSTRRGAGAVAFVAVIVVFLLALNGSFAPSRAEGLLARAAAFETPSEAAKGTSDTPTKTEAPSKDSSGKDNSSKDKAAKSKTATKVAGFTKEREAAAFTFVREHHPELANLLEQLKADDRIEYRRAVVELFAASERLAQIQENNPARYELELRLWKLNSRIHVLAARLSMGIDPAADDELRRALADELLVRQQLIQLERDRAAVRLGNLEKQLETLRRDEPTQIEQRRERVLKNARSGLSAAAVKVDATSVDPSAAKAVLP